MSKRSQSTSAGLALVRFLTGCTLFGRGWIWVRGEGFDGRLVLENTRAALLEMNGLLHWWGESVVLSNPDASALIWRWAALLIGVCLMLGALTRPAGIIACFFLLQGYVFGPESTGMIFWLLIIPCLGCAVGSAGRNFGMDKLLDESCPSWLTWSTSKKRGNIFS